MISDVGTPSAGAVTKCTPLAVVSPQKKCQSQSLSADQSDSATVTLKRAANNTDAIATSTSKRSKIENLGDANRLLTPNFDTGDNMQKLSWSTDKSVVSGRQTRRDDLSVRDILMAMSRGNLHRAAAVLSHFLSSNNNQPVRDFLLQSLAVPIIDKAAQEKLTWQDLIIGGVRGSLSHHTVSLGTRTITTKTFVKNMISACVFKIVKEGVSISTEELSGLIGVHWRQVSACRDKVASLMVNNVIITALKRKT